MKYKTLLYYIFKLNSIKNKGKNLIDIAGKLKRSKIKIIGNNNKLVIKNARVNRSNITIRGNNNVIIIEKDCDLNNLTIIMENSNSKIEIREGTTCGKTQIVSFEPYDIIIGKNCMISYDVEIRNTDSHKIFEMETNKRINEGKKIIIGNNVWIASKSMILKGSEIGDGSIVGTGTILNKKMDKNIIIAGVPAREIRKNVYWNRDSVIPK